MYPDDETNINNLDEDHTLTKRTKLVTQILDSQSKVDQWSWWKQVCHL